jgi:hypothetical protein
MVKGTDKGGGCMAPLMKKILISSTFLVFFEKKSWI